MNKIENDILNLKLKKICKELENANIFSERGIRNDKQMSFSFVVYTAERFLNNFNIEEVIENITDGGEDKSIDIFNIDAENDTVNINIFQCKYKKQNILETIGENDIIKFERKIEQVIINDDTEHVNPYLKHQLGIYKDIIKDKSLSNINVNLYLVTNGADLNKNEKDSLSNFKERHSIINKIVIYNNYEFFIDSKETEIEEMEIQISDDITKMNNDISACIVNFKTYELANLYEKFQDRILEKNVRKLLKSSINKNIADSLINDPKMFWYKNNGLSIVCRRWEQKKINGNNVLILENPYIVNGGQTTKTIYNLYKDCTSDEDRNCFYDSYIMARIYQTTDEDKIAAIVQGTNNQNKITLYDLKSSNINLKKIKEFFKENNISLLIKRDIEEEKLEKSINSDLLLQIYCASYMEIPHKSKISKNKLIEDYYDDVYSNANIHKELLNSFNVYDFVKANNRNLKYEHLNHSTFSILYLIYKLRPELKNEINLKLLDETYKKAIDILNKIVDEQKNKDENYSHHNFFKSEKSTTAINEYLKKYQKSLELARK